MTEGQPGTTTGHVLTVIADAIGARLALRQSTGDMAAGVLDALEDAGYYLTPTMSAAPRCSACPLKPSECPGCPAHDTEEA